MARQTPPPLYRRSVALGLSLSLLTLPIYPQQSGIQSSFLRAVLHTSEAAGTLADVIDTEHIPYITEVTRENQGTSVFHPSSSDMLIQQAEEKFRTGSRFYLSGDFDHARS